MFKQAQVWEIIMSAIASEEVNEGIFVSPQRTLQHCLLVAAWSHLLEDGGFACAWSEIVFCIKDPEIPL